MKQKHDGRLVEVRGTLKSDLQPQAGYGTNVGGMRITIGGPTAGPAGGREAETRKSLPVVDVSGFEVPRPAAAAECGIFPALAALRRRSGGPSIRWARSCALTVSVALLLSPARAGSARPSISARRARSRPASRFITSPTRRCSIPRRRFDLAAAGESRRGRSPRRALQRRDRRYRDRPGHRRPAWRHRRDQRRLLPAPLRRSSGDLQAARSARQRHETAARRRSASSATPPGCGCSSAAWPRR